MNSVTLWLIIVAEKSTLAVYGNRITESRERTEDERTETPTPEAIGWAFSGWMKRNSERLSELCASVVNNPSSKIIQGITSFRDGLISLWATD